MLENEARIEELKGALPQVAKATIVTAPEIEGVDTNEEVIMVEAPQATTVMVETGSGETILCSGLPSEVEGELGNADRVVFRAIIRRNAEVIVSAIWAEWID